MREIQTGHIHSRIYQADQHLLRRCGRTDGANDLCLAFSDHFGHFRHPTTEESEPSQVHIDVTSGRVVDLLEYGSQREYGYIDAKITF
jgi:hypothetical protein